MDNQIKSTIFGLAIGDAVGVPYEFKHREELTGIEEVPMRGYGSHQQPVGTWSDDTSLTLCLLESLTEELNYNDIANKFLKWETEAYLTATNEVFDIGNGTHEAINNTKQYNLIDNLCNKFEESIN